MAVLGSELYVANNQDGTVCVIDTIEPPWSAPSRGRTPLRDGGGPGRVFVTDYGFYGGQSTHSGVGDRHALGGLVVDRFLSATTRPESPMSPDDRRLRQPTTKARTPPTSRHYDGHRHRNDTVVDTLAVGGNSIAVGETERSLRGRATAATAVHQHAVDHRSPSPADHRRTRSTACRMRWLPMKSDLRHRHVAFLSAAGLRAETSVVDTDTANGRPTLTITRIDGDDDIVVFETTISDSGQGPCDRARRRNRSAVR